MSASVWQLRAEVGDTLEPGDQLLVLESMKMEIPVVAPVAGVLRELSVGAGDPVTAGQVLAVIDEA